MAKYLPFIAIGSAIVYHIVSNGENHSLKPFVSSVDNHVYQVLPDDGEGAANAIARLHQNIKKVLVRVAEEQKTVDRFTAGRARLLQRVNERGINIAELDSAEYDSLAINRNKSEQILICLRTEPPKDKQIAKDDTLLFIALHELAHSMVDGFANSIDGRTVHNAEFRQNEKYLMDVASGLGLLSPAIIPGRIHCSRIIPNPEDAL